ncbi:MAG: 5-methyltetrahydrofolate--homocysteine methyltransferase [uncultured Solirubrobacterales bacterium]|uniref:Methionine synthase n=1 Tax=uncultured Solirubrobacterales bacterium TaxID=768556 RepID=A0A6J4T0T3_9ACTN|nr:MAG: 5-methyltetrahydrofolate--homocysteine methyltransferase [uncultured Solirubrobacterales bacterium]
MRNYLEAIRAHVVVFDGGMGATLEQYDLTSEDYGGLAGKCHEALVLNRPDVIQGVHESMIAAGAEAVQTDTFQASRLKLDEWGLGEQTLEINRGAGEIARAAAGEERFVVGSVGPTGMLPASDDPTLGGITFAELREIFAEQCQGLIEGGVDVILIETAQDILEVKAAVFGARDAFVTTGRSVPIQTQVSLLPNGGKMLLGTDISSVLTTLTSLGVDALGLNCSTGPEDMRDAIRFLGEHSPVPVSCIPNAGIPHQGPNGETIFPEEPDPLADVLADFVTRYGVAVVGGCCGTTPDHIRAIVERVGDRTVEPRPADAWPPHLSSLMTATPLVQEPRPSMVGERVNSQGSRKAKEMLLADDYDGLVQIAEDQVEGGAHVLDICVALTERQDEDEQMRETAKRISLTQPAPIQIDSTEPEVIQKALEQISGRAVVNSINLEAGRDKADGVIPLATAHGAALIALTIDEVGMAKTADRKVEIAERIRDIACGEHGLDPELLIFDVLTFTLTTGDEEWRPSAVETIEGIRRVKAEVPGVKTSLGVSNVSFGVSPPARAVLNSVFLHHCVEAGLDLAMVNPNHIVPYGEISDEERDLADDLVFNRREDALERFIAHFEEKGEEAEDEKADPTAEMEPEDALHFRILRRKKDGVEGDIDRAVEKLGAVPVLNDVLLPAMKEVGDKFGAGELILPFVLQSAEVMKRAVAQLENYLDRIEGYTKGTVVLATVFGDVHDIGKSLVNTILSNNGYTVVDLGKQVPIGTIVEAAKEHDATAIGLSALLVSTSKQMPACVGELHEQGLEYPVLVGGAAINRNFGKRILYPGGKESEDIYEPGVFYCKDAFEGLNVMDQLVEGDARKELVTQIRDDAKKFREQGDEPEDLPTDDDTVRSGARTDVPVPAPPFWGVREIDVDLDDVFAHLDLHVLFKLHWGGRGVKGEAWEKLLNGDFRPRLERMWREQDYLRPQAVLGYFPCASEGNELVVFDPEDAERELERLVFPRQPKHDRICIADFYRPLESGERDVVALQAVTAGPEVTDVMAQLERDGEFAEQLFTHGLGVQTAEGMAEWLHAEVRTALGIDPDQGRRWSWGYPACPDQAEHEKVFRLLEADRIGLSLSGGYAVEPEQSTVAIIAHHPQAVYFGMKSGRLPAEASPDTVIHDPRRRVGHRVKDGAVFFDDDADAYDASREEVIEDNDPQAGSGNGRVGEAAGELDPA